MPKPIVFEGCCTALVTPFLRGNVDYEAFGRLLDFQVENGADAILVCGTTGESATLTEDECFRVISFAVDRVAGRVPLLAGTGSNDTRKAIEKTRFAKDAGADAVLLVTPYYNKANPSGLIRHFETIADCAEIPNILYNVPSRTGVQIPLSAYERLSRHPNIVGVKEASGNLSSVLRLMEACGEELAVYSGNDDQTVALMAMGAKGVISVVSNLLPGRMHDLCLLCRNGRYDVASKQLLHDLPLINSLFMLVNPVPVKTALAKMELCSSELRLPLSEPEPEEAEALFSVMKKMNLI